MQIISLVILAGLCVHAPLIAAPERVTLAPGEARVLQARRPKKALVGDKGVADARTLSDGEVLLSGKALGQTSLTVWDADGKRVWEVEVSPSASKHPMIQMDVQVLELLDAGDWDVGIDWARLAAGDGSAVAGTPPSALNVREQANPSLLAFGTLNRGPLDLLLRALVQKNKARLLAKPRLLTVSGGTARFLSGGQIPVVHQDSQGHSNTQYKDYGISLEIQPRVSEGSTVHSSVRAEVSNLDNANAVTVGNGVVPALRTRWVETTVDIRKDATLVIAGLLQEEESEVTRGVPILSDIPLLGLLFKSHKIERRHTELVIFLTPRIL